MTKQDVTDALAQLGAKADVLADRISDKKLSTEDAEEIQSQVSELKEHVGAEYKRLQNRKIDTDDYEHTFYWPAIQDSWANYKLSSLHTNTRPTEKWASVLREVAFAARYWTPRE